MATNGRVINGSADDGTLISRSAECLQELPTDGVYLCWDRVFTYSIFTTYDSARGITSTVQKCLDELRDMILDTDDD